MTDVFEYTKGSTPLLISIPHDGRALMPGQDARMTDVGRSIPDTDWFVRELYAFATDIGASIVAANYSRYVVDLNRPADDAALYEGQVSTGLCPLQTFAGQPIYLDGETVTTNEQQDRVRHYWRPYHDKIEDVLHDLHDDNGVALLWDAHSIASEVPALFPGVLTDLNVGTDGGKSCNALIESSVMNVATASDYTSVANGRFRGGFITRHYGKPEKNIHAIQLELSQRCYLDESNLSYDAELAVRVGATIKKMLIAFMHVVKGPR
jgi:N-formylglutamate amidohydrolase